ncbi:hypothetical protein FisN_6Lh049 [Fistulifera solaris]|uniref:Meiotically up-regulated gene 157 protein n=1 Tax=Fistulifera solaris TaxID=1519565 RepID=A0A1Z5KP86_FISSO|nr:hypothetical protein FisN_6Lh049 [Fistulifera solaris]|eukprot:GAX28134.1 hypothetical protein FisN_6Lh049 [Fistulifera solaris]
MRRLWKRHERKPYRSRCVTLAIIVCGGLLLFWITVLIFLFGVLFDHAAYIEKTRVRVSQRFQLRAKAKPKKATSSLTDLRMSPLSSQVTPIGYTFGHAVRANNTKPSYFFGLPAGVAAEHQYRYQSNGIFWEDTHDPLYQKYHQIVFEEAKTQVKDFQLAPDVETYQQKLRQQLQHIGMQVGNLVVPAPLRRHQQHISHQLRQARLDTLADIFDNSYAFTLEQTTFPLSDGTTYVITGDIELMWLRDSSAQVHPYIPLLSQSDYLLHLVEGLLRRQSLFIQADPYATSFRLFLDFDFVHKQRLTDWDYQSGRTIHVAMHNFELDNLAYHLRLSHKLFQFYQHNNRPMLALDSNWIRGVDLILQTVVREQNHAESPYRYPELQHNGKGQPVCKGDGLVWVGFRPSDDPTEFGYLIPANQMMAVSLRQTADIFRSMEDDIRAQQCEELAESIDKGIHAHGVIQHDEFGKIYAYEVDACGGNNLMDDANVPSLLSLEYLEYSSPQYDPDQKIQKNTRKFSLSKSNPYFYSGEGPDGCTNEGIGSPHTAKSSIWHMAIILRALTAESDAELRQAVSTLARTAKNNLMHESFRSTKPSTFSRKSFAWANSLFAELITTKLDDILRVYRNETLNSC